MPEPSRAPTHASGRSYSFYPLVMTGFVVVLLASNLIGPAKACRIELPFALPFVGQHLDFGAGNIFFPISYIFGDVLTEVYGYARARRVIWAGFGAMLFVTLMIQVVLHLPAKSDEPYNQILQPALETVFGSTWRVVAASMLAYWLGDFVNSYVLARMKVLTRGRFLWMRTIGSTVVGQGVDSLVFYPLAFYGMWNTNTLLRTTGFNWFFKVSIEVLFTPLTYLVVNALKRAEHEDYYDYETDFTPFSLKD
jgi:uncharacterized integral membrane protein (TIGR00697 family)